MLRNDGMPALSANTPVRAACRGWPWLTCSPPGEGAGAGRRDWGSPGGRDTTGPPWRRV